MSISTTGSHLGRSASHFQLIIGVMGLSPKNLCSIKNVMSTISHDYIIYAKGSRIRIFASHLHS